MDIDGITFDMDLPDDTHSSHRLAVILDHQWDEWYGTYDPWRGVWMSGEDSQHKGSSRCPTA